MNNKKRFITNIIEIAVGVVLSGCGFAGILDEFWSGMGTALVIVGALKLVRQIRYQTSSSYKEAVDVQINDERNKYLRMKAWSWAGYLFVLIAAFALFDLPLLQTVALLMVSWQLIPSAIVRIFSINFPIQLLATFAMIPICLYNGKKHSRSPVIQWGFYLFYPVHLAILWLILLRMR